MLIKTPIDDLFAGKDYGELAYSKAQMEAIRLLISMGIAYQEALPNINQLVRDSEDQFIDFLKRTLRIEVPDFTPIEYIPLIKSANTTNDQ